MIDFKNKNIAIIVESPFQLLCAFEAINYFKLDNYILFYRVSGNEINDKQMRNIIYLLDIKNIKEIFIPVDNRVSKILKSLYFYLRVIRFDFIFLGRYKSSFMKPIKKYFGLDKIMFLDDGLETIETQKELYNKNIAINMFSTCDYMIVDRRKFFFNSFKYIKKKFSETKAFQDIFVGALHVEVGRITKEEYIEIIKNIIQKYKIKKLFYYPHRVEDKKKLQELEKIDELIVVKPKYTIELYLLVNKIKPRSIYSYRSTAIHTLNIFFPDVKIIMIEPEFKNLKPMLKKIRKVSADQNRIELIHNYLRNINNVTSLKVKNGRFIEEK